MQHYPVLNGNAHSALIEELRAEQQTLLSEEKTKPATVRDNHELLQRLLNIQHDVLEKSRQEVVFSVPLIYIDDMPFIYPNTIAVISAKTGLHKSRLAEVIASAVLSGNNDQERCLGLRARTKCAVALIDTERNLMDQLPYSIQCISRLTHHDEYEPPDELFVTSVLQEPRPERFEALRYFIDHIKHKTKKHIVVIIDVLTDICVNFNDPRDTSPLIDMLNETINNTQCSFLVVIHQNPSQFDNKSRGHLGTEIENKASTIITIGSKDNESLCIECKKQRSTKKFNPVYVRYDALRKTLVRLGASEIEQIKAVEEKHIDWAMVFGNDTALPRKELETRLVAMKLASSKRTAIRRIEEAKQYGDIEKGVGNKAPYTLPQRLPKTEDLPFEND